MEPEAQVEVIEPIAPTGEVVSPELIGEVEAEVAPVPSEAADDDHSQEIADLQDAVEKADTPEAKADQQKKLNTKFAEMRRERRDAKKTAEEARVEAAHWKGRAEALAEMGQKERQEEAPVQPAPDTTGRPVEEDFDDYSAFVEALSDWKTDQKFAQREAEQAKKDANKAMESWVSQGKARFPDFEAVVTKPFDKGGPAISPAMVEIINSSDVSHELAYHLGKNPEISRQIASLAPLAAARALGRLEAKLASATPIKPKTQSNAPVPIRPVAGDGATAIVDDLEKMSEAEYIAYQNRREFGTRK